MAYAALRRVLFRLDPERAHQLTLGLLRAAGAVAPVRALVRRLLGAPAAAEAEVFGVRFPNRVGLAAGYDKDASAWRGLAALGFGHIEVGTVTPLPQPGNPRPRVFRLEEDASLINRLGFPSRGGRVVARRLRGRRPYGVRIGVNLGKQKDTPLEEAHRDYAKLLDLFAPLADYVVVNVSSPNTPGLRDLQRPAMLRRLLEPVASRRDVLAEFLDRRLPVLLKLAPDLGKDELPGIVEVARESGLDGFVAINTTLSRPASLRSPRASESGGLSGAALAPLAEAFLRHLAALAGPDLPVIACGGILGGEDARRRLEAGASLVQVYTGLVYRGPGLVREIVRATDPPSARRRGA